MGTTDSILYDAEEEERRERPPSRDISEHSAPSRRSSIGSASLRSSPRPTARPPFTLKGLILGLDSSGKRTLVQRLEGKDPFIPNRGENEVSSSITVPYQPPARTTVWDRIQLQVDLSEPQNELPVDFYVVLVNPRHDRETVREYLVKNIIPTIIERAERVLPVAREEEKVDAIHRPVCLCLLLNFRDLHDISTDRSSAERIELRSLKEWAEKRLAKLKLLNTNHIIMECGTTSLRNCYGLSRLHHFIYRVYLLRKQIELEQRLMEVKDGLQKASASVPEQPYEEFLSVLERAEAKQASKGNTAIRPGTTRALAGIDGARLREVDLPQRQGGVARSRNQVTTETPKEEAGRTPTATNKADRSPIVKGPTAPRSVMQTRTLPVDRKKALDDFFADDDDGEAEAASPAPPRPSKEDLDSSDEEDNDYFYDERGKRHEHLLGPDESSDEQAEVAEQHSTKMEEIAAVVTDKSCEEVDLPKGDQKTTKKQKTPNPAPRSLSETELSEESEVGDEEGGWGDDDLDIEDEISAHEKPNTDLKAMQPTEAASSDTAKSDIKRTDGHLGEEEAGKAESNGSPEHDEETINSPGDGSINDSTPVCEDDERDEGAMTKTSSRSSGAAPMTDEVESEDDVFVVQDTRITDRWETGKSPVEETKSPVSDLRQPDAKTRHGGESSDPTTGGISAAALAAIAAAEREAQVMLQEAERPPDSKPEKKVKKDKSKKKKDPDAKKKKKRKKEGKRTADVDSS